MNFIPTYHGHTADGGTNFFAIFSAMYSHVITVHHGNENSHAIKFDYTKLVAILHIYQTITRRGGYSTMFSEPDVNNCFGIIAQVLSNAVGNSVNKESIAHV